MTPPFSESSVSEVLVRVLVAVVKREYKRHPSTLSSWGAMRNHLYHRLPPDAHLPGLITTLLAADAAVKAGRSFTQWADDAIKASRCGYTWRRCLYQPYKASRDPRVTNRGVRRQRSMKGA